MRETRNNVTAKRVPGTKKKPSRRNLVTEFKFDASKSLGQDVEFAAERRRGSLVEPVRSAANKELFYMHAKEIKVRTPRRGHRRKILIPGTHGAIRNFPINRLNHYDSKLKMHKGSVKLDSDLESIDEAASSEDYDGA